MTHRVGSAQSDVNLERRSQDMKWGETNHDPFTWLAILQKQIGEYSNEALLLRFQREKSSHARLRKECVQVAAVALAMVECLDRALWDWPE